MNEIYLILRKKFPMNVVAIHHFGKILINYQNSGFAPPHLISELETYDEGKLWSHMWEALLYTHISGLGLKLVKGNVAKSGQKGPDFHIRYKGKNIWIEAVAPAPVGIPAEHLQPICRIRKFKVGSEPYEKKLLRWTAAIKEKRDKFKNYIADGTISADDVTVIAVNSCRLQDFAFDDRGISQFPYAVEATFPVGPLAIPLGRDGKADGSAQNIARYSVRNKNNAEVRTDNFLNSTYQNVSAVLGSHQRDLWRGRLHLSLVHNPQALNPLQPLILGAADEYICRPSSDGYELCNLNKDSAEGQEL